MFNVSINMLNPGYEHHQSQSLNHCFILENMRENDMRSRRWN